MHQSTRTSYLCSLTGLGNSRDATEAEKCAYEPICVNLHACRYLLVHVFKKASRCMKPYATGVASHLDSWHSRYVRPLNSTFRT